MPHGSTKSPSAVVETRRVAPRPRVQAPPARGRLLVWAMRAAAPLGRLITLYPGRSAAAAASAAMMAGIVGNATLMQRGRHPAPLFAPPQVASPPAPARVARHAAPDTAPRLAVPEAAPRPAVPGAVGPPVPPVRPLLRAEETAHEAAQGGPPGDSLPTGVATPKAPDPDVLRAQHALVRLGFDLKPDGHLGTATRKALDKFASTHHLGGMPATLTPGLLQALTAAAAKPQG